MKSSSDGWSRCSGDWAAQFTATEEAQIKSSIRFPHLVSGFQ